MRRSIPGVAQQFAWLRTASAPEGSAERALSDLLRRRGVSAVLSGLAVSVDVLGRWLDARAVPPDRAAGVLALAERLLRPESSDALRSMLAAEQRLGIGRVSVEEAAAMRAGGATLTQIGEATGVSSEGVRKRLAGSAKKPRSAPRRGGDDAA